MRRRRTLFLTVPALLLTGLMASGCYTWFHSEFPVGKFQPQLIPQAVYIHPRDDFVLGSDLLIRDDEILIAGSRAIGTFNLDYSLNDIRTLNRSSNSFKHKPWYFLSLEDTLYVASLKLIVTPYRNRDYYVLAARGISPNTQNYELDLPDTSVNAPLALDFDGDGSESLVIVHPASPARVLIYDDFATPPKSVELPTFMPLQFQVVDLDCDSTDELFVELLPLSESDDEFQFSVVSGTNTSLQPVLTHWQSIGSGDSFSCVQRTVQNFKNPRILSVRENSVQLVDWSMKDTAIVIHDQHNTEFERWDLSGKKGLGYISGWHVYRTCDDMALAEDINSVDCIERRFAVVSQSLTSCGRANAPCGSVLVELFDNGKYEEIWRSPASTRISHLLENGDLLLHSGNSLVTLNIFTFEDSSR